MEGDHLGDLGIDGKVFKLLLVNQKLRVHSQGLRMVRLQGLVITWEVT
jgi:hypothetical protein